MVNNFQQMFLAVCLSAAQPDAGLEARCRRRRAASQLEKNGIDTSGAGRRQEELLPLLPL